MSSAWDGLVNTREVTELPHYAINQSLPEDSFFTDRDIAEYCYAKFLQVCGDNGIKVEQYRFIEPSAGEGCFYDLLPLDSIGLDINPQHRAIVQADFLTWYPQVDGKYIVIGNPPFGVRGAVALAFLNRALLFADVVAFILPMSFYSNGKGSNMKRVQGAGLLFSEELPRDSFYMPTTGATVSVNTLFQVWGRGMEKSVFSDYDVSAYADIFTCCSAPNRYCGLGRGRDYDCFIASTFYGNDIGIVNNFADVKYGSGYGLVIKQDKAGVIKALQEAKWGDYSSSATNSCKHIRMYHIRRALGDAGYGVQV